MALTLRTTEKFDDHLEALKSRLDIGTGSGVITFVIGNYANTVDELQETRRELAKKNKQLEQLIDIHSRKMAIEKEFSFFLKEFNIK
ncbi:MAG: hypothetical protein KKD05_06265 [Candidatus Omnitrophica bacterium]|nr:hypothetical protein [Candidatus Omnitrophota bacterium]